jgi:hypothetical protein
VRWKTFCEWLRKLCCDFDQRQFEVQALAGEGMIRIEGDCVVGEIGYDKGNLTLRGLHFNGHPDFRFDIAQIKLITSDGLRKLLNALTITLFGWTWFFPTVNARGSPPSEESKISPLSNFPV